MTAESHTLRGRSVAPGELRPLDTDLRSESRALAEALRGVFGMLKTSLGDFAADCNRDKGAVSRYLSGKRVPPRQFIDVLVREALRVQGEVGVPASLAENLRKLHLCALEAYDPHSASLQRLEDEIRLHASRKEALEIELARNRREIGRLRRQARTTEEAREHDSSQIVKDLERRLKEATDERRRAEMCLAMERTAGRTYSTGKDHEELGLLGCPV
jgi:hypothetical protein